MRVRVDHEVCQGHGVCVATAPTLFVMRDDDKARVCKQPESSEEEALAQRAIRGCPERAIQSD